MTAILEYAIYERLKSIVSNRVYILRAPQNATSPFIVIQRISGERWRDINAPSGLAQAMIQIDCYGVSFDAMKAINLSVETQLDGYRGTVYYGSASPQDSVRIAGISLQSEADVLEQTEEPFLYRNTANYLVTYEQ